jgi:ABC-type glycerol-3-phosphate transport system substrate-binding protein
VPHKAVAIYLLLALLGAVIFVYCTFPRTKDQIPTSNNQRPFDEPPPLPNPGNVPVPETPPHPSTPSAPHGPTLRVMAWASPSEATALDAQLDAYGSPDGWTPSLTLANDEATYRRDLAAAIAAGTPPDVCLVDARDFSGLDPARDLASLPADAGANTRSVGAFTMGGAMKAAPSEFTVDLLFYDPSCFVRAGLAAPGPHWNWDVLEAMARALASLHFKNGQGAPVYALELPADFDFWNMLCMQAGHPALDANTWHVADVESRDAEVRSLDFIHQTFQDFDVTAPLAQEGAMPGRYFGRQQAAMMIGPSALVSQLPNFGYQVTELPRDMSSGSLACVHGWAVSAQSPQVDAAARLAAFLARRPLHAGWTGVYRGDAADGFSQICQAVLAGSVIPRVGARDAAMARFLNDTIDQLARQSSADTNELYARIQAQYRSDFPEDTPKASDGIKPHASSEGELRDL